MSDAYRCFEDLAKQRAEGVDFRIDISDRASPVTILAPHGGRIEPGTSEIASAIAGVQYSLYRFEGLLSENNRVLHITSVSFDERRASELVERSDVVIAVHGRRDALDARTIWLGGRDTDLRDAIGESLSEAQFAATTDHDLPGIRPENICNRGRTGAGVQLEIPCSLREALLKDPSRLQAFAAAVQGAIDKLSAGAANRANPSIRRTRGVSAGTPSRRDAKDARRGRTGNMNTMPTREQPSLIVRQQSPLNLEFPFASLSEWLIPTDRFFVRNHFPTPDLDAGVWTLRVDGAVERPLELDLDGLRAMRSSTLTAIVECAGNGRVYYAPPREGLQWQNGAVGNAAWTGVLLRDILEMAGVKPSAREVLLVGADSGIVDTNKKTASPGPIAFARSLPLEKAIADCTMLAYSMNDAPLTREHGYPLRAVVGGWFGMAWVKWITHIRVMEQPFLGYWQARDYFRWERSAGEPMLVPLSEMEVKAQIARPVHGAQLIAGQPYRIFGAAWSGEAPVREVQVCTGDGQGWREAQLLDTEHPYAWRLWESIWTPELVGRYTLRCRAIDRAGRAQPEGQRSDCESYAANWIIPVKIAVVPEPPTYEGEFVI